jgi:hypothetical protein
MKQISNLGFLKKNKRQNLQSFGHANYVYKPLVEKDIHDSLHIPKLVWPRDFSDKNQNQQILENDYDFVKSLKQRDDAINANPSSVLTPELLKQYSSDFRLKTYLTTNKSELMQNTLLAQQDEKILNTHLHSRIKGNIGKFNDSFNNLEQLKLDMHEAKVKTIMVKESAQKLKRLQLENLVKVQRLNQKKINICKTAEILKYIMLLQRSVPVITDLI